MATKWLEDKLTNGEVITEDDIKRLLKDFTGKGKTKPEGNVFDFKAEFVDEAEGKCKLTKSLVEFANGSGGVLVYGVDDNGGRIGCAEELLDRLDPAKIQDILEKYVSFPQSLRIITCGIQLDKFCVAVIVYPSLVPIVFEKNGEYHRQLSGGGSKLKIEFYEGTIYVRDGAKSTPVRQRHLNKIVERAATERAKLLVRRVQQVAQLPPDADIVAVPKGSNAGIKLVSTDEGIPVTVVENLNQPAVPVRGILTTRPFSRLETEMMAQLRAYRTDNSHRVAAKVVTRWHLGLDTDDLEVQPQVAELAFLSALKYYAFPMFWAAMMPRESLRNLIEDLIEDSPWPEVQQLPYVIGAFFWEERHILLESVISLVPHKGVTRSAEKVKDLDRTTFLCHSKNPPRSALVPTTEGTYEVELEQLLRNHHLAERLFYDLLRISLTKQLEFRSKALTRQLEIMLFADISGRRFPESVF